MFYKMNKTRKSEDHIAWIKFLFSLFPISATIIATVLCDPYFYGEDCSKVCSRYVNGSHGRCNATGQLKCDKNYFGPKCTIFCVDKNNGSCNDYGNLICDEHFYGDECSRYCVDTTHGNCSLAGYLYCQDGQWVGSFECQLINQPFLLLQQFVLYTYHMKETWNKIYLAWFYHEINNRLYLAGIYFFKECLCPFSISFVR